MKQKGFNWGSKVGYLWRPGKRNETDGCKKTGTMGSPCLICSVPFLSNGKIRPQCNFEIKKKKKKKTNPWSVCACVRDKDIFPDFLNAGNHFKSIFRDLPGGSVVKTPMQGMLRSHMSQGQKTQNIKKKQNTEVIV